MITIYGELYSSKNSRVGIIVGGRNVVIKSKKAQGQEKDFQYQLSAVRRQFLKLIKGRIQPLRIEFKIYRRTHGRFDYINIVQGLLDAMVRAELIPDDDAKHIIPVFVPYEKDEKTPRTEITIL